MKYYQITVSYKTILGLNYSRSYNCNTYTLQDAIVMAIDWCMKELKNKLLICGVDVCHNGYRSIYFQ